MSKTESTTDITATAGGALAARELASAVNSPELMAEHLRLNAGKTRTRFPPEPNGYLHVGHCKSMCMNFEIAFEKLGVPVENRETIFRYDDTNPEAESNEYIDSLREDVAWLGWKPLKTTHTSDYFDQLFDLAVELIKKGKAYVCHQTKADIEVCREVAKAQAADPSAPGNANSPWRDRTPEENLRLFYDMKNGKYDAGAATLRLKMDMHSPNPNMWDQVAYRIKYLPHPHAGDKWCVYPTYDYTHCLIDSIEHVDYSICTLEFESRRESYYWVLEALDMYRPKVYEMSRLNLCYTMLSKRKLLKLVTSGYMRGWDDPRMPTIKGLRRRGYTPEALNAFVKDVGVTRNENSVQYERLEAMARTHLHEDSPRVMAVLQPLKVVLTGRPVNDNSTGAFTTSVPNFPFDASRGSHDVFMEGNEIYIDSSDFRVIDSDDFYGLSVNKLVGLKYCPFAIRCDKVETDASGTPTLLHCTCVSSEDPSFTKPKGLVQWVSAGASGLLCEVREYNHLFTVEEVGDAEWESQLNPLSEVIHSSARVDASVLNTAYNTAAESHFQFERLGFFVVDKDSDFKAAGGKLVFNRTVTLKDSKPKVEGAPSRSRKEEQAAQAAEKLARMSISPRDMYKNDPLYSAFDADGVPTHDAAKEPLAKNAIKKLKKEWDKQKRLFESNGGVVA